MKKKEIAISILGEMISDFFHYDRKNCPDISKEDLELLIKTKALTREEIIKALVDSVNGVFSDYEL